MFQQSMYIKGIKDFRSFKTGKYNISLNKYKANCISACEDQKDVASILPATTFQSDEENCQLFEENITTSCQVVFITSL